MTHVALTALTLCVAASLGAQKPMTVVRQPLAETAAIAERNPKTFRATQLLDVRRPGVAPRIRFEWEQVPGSQEYVLTGRWTNAQSWELRSHEYRITARSATRWENGRVTFDISLPEGNHSWKLVAVFGPNDAGDYAHPAHVSFDIR